jgi:class 3 adenylate cyclase
LKGITRLDKLLVAILAPVWLVLVALQIDRLTSEWPLAWFPAYLEAAPPEGFPTVRSLWPDAPEVEGRLLPGDVLRSVGETSLQGASRFAVIAQAYVAAVAEGERRVVSFRVTRGGAEREAWLALRLVAFPWSHLVFSIGLGLSAILVLLRGRGQRAPRYYALAAMAYALHFASLYAGLAWQTALGFGLLIVTAGLYPPLLLRAALVFPPSAAPRGRLAYAWPWLLAAGAPAGYVWLFGSPALGYAGFAPLGAVFAVTQVAMVVVLVRNYRLGDARGRRQMRWALYGLVCGTFPPAVLSVAAGFEPALRPLYEASLVTHLVIPVCLFIAFVQYRLFDIDRLISATAALTIAAVVPVAVLLTYGADVARSVSEATGLQPGTVFGLLIAALLSPVPWATRRLRPRLSLLLFPERLRFERSVRALRAALGECTGSEDLFRTLGKRLLEIVPLQSFATYVRVEGSYAAAFARGPLVPAAFPAAGPLCSLVAAADGPVRKPEWRRWGRRGLLDAAELAGLEGLAVEILLPVRCDDVLEAFLLVGAKESGDIFTEWESALLEGLAERASAQLARFGDADRVARERRLADALRRYVPATVERVLASGEAPASGEREVSIFFVDVRGSTAYAEGRSDAEVFAMVDRFTTGAAEIVERAGGTVVEFAGDGFMAVFGAEGAPGKEGAAIGAGRAIHAAVREGLLPAEELPARAIGVGIATGSAYIGDVQIGSHAIWTALGDTANLAARLESLTKDFEAAMVIDERTRRGAGEAASDFNARGETHIRGRSEPETLYVLTTDGPGNGTGSVA